MTPTPTSSTPLSEAKCGTCKHWNGEEESWDSEAAHPWGKCKRIHHGYWQKLFDDDPEYGRDYYAKKEGIDNFQAQTAFTMDGSDYTSSLNTHANFGCILHESAEQTRKGE